jgi:hypothetical protein
VVGVAGELFGCGVDPVRGVLGLDGFDAGVGEEGDAVVGAAGESVLGGVYTV